MTIKDFLFILLLVFQAFINHTTTQNLLVQIDKLNLALVANVSKITELSEQIHAAKLHQIATTVVETSSWTVNPEILKALIPLLSTVLVCLTVNKLIFNIDLMALFSKVKGEAFDWRNLPSKAGTDRNDGVSDIIYHNGNQPAHVGRPNDAPLPQVAHGGGHQQALIIAGENDALIVIPKSPTKCGHGD